METEQITPGERLRAERKRREWGVIKLSELSGISVPQLYNIESGKSPIGYKADKALCRILGLDQFTFLNLRE